MKPLYKQPLIEAAILASGIMCTVLLIHGVQNFIAMGGKPATSQIAEKSNPDLVPVAAASNCPYSASVSMGQTAVASEMRINPTSDPKVYDPFPQKYKNVLNGTKPPGTALAAGQKDTKLPILGTIFGYKPSSANYYQVLENDGSKLTGTTWEQYLLGIPTDVGAEIKAPQTGYDIGGGKMGLVVYATSDQITIHVGRHEYLSGGNSAESGGYWIYLKGLCVNDQIVAQYNANATSRKQLPELAKGELLGYANKTEVLVAVRDNGPFTDILAPEWWTGVPAKTVVPPVDGGGNPDPGGGTKLDLNVACTDDAKCLSGNCSLQSNPPIKLCKQGTLIPGAVCTHQSQCASDKCEGGKCLAQAPGTYTVSGTITVTGAGIGDNYVMALYQDSTDVKGATQPSKTGEYNFAGVAKGKYQVAALLVRDSHYDYGDVITSSSPVDIEVKDSSVTQALTIPAPAATTSTVSGTITLAGGIGTNKVRVQIFNDAATPVLKYQNDPSTNLTYSIPGVINGTYQIRADLINSADTITSSSPDKAFVVNGSDIKDLELSIPAPATAPPTTGVPDWVTGNNFCLDNTKQSSCTTAGLIQKDVLYCATGSGSALYPFVHLSAYSENCTYGGVPYLKGTRWIDVIKSSSQDRGYSICEYLASENNSPPKVKCAGDGRACSLVCNLSQNIDYKIKILNGTSKSVDILEINKVEATIYGDPIITGTATGNKLEYNVSVPSKRIKEVIQGSSQFYLTIAYTLQYPGGSKNFTSVLNGIDLPKGNSAEFSITITDN